MSSNNPNRTQLDEIIREQHRRDSRLRIISRVAWSVLGLGIFVYAMIAVGEFLYIQGRSESPFFSWHLWATLIPLLGVVSLASFFVALLSTIGRFLNARYATMNEVQVRLESLEDLVVRHLDKSSITE